MKFKLIGSGVIISLMLIAMFVSNLRVKSQPRILDDEIRVSTSASSNQSTLDIGSAVLSRITSERGLLVRLAMTNDLGEPIRISVESKSCGCIDLEISNELLDVGDTAYVQLKLSTLAYPADIKHYVGFRLASSEDPNSASFHVFTVKGHLVPDIWFDGNQHISVEPGALRNSLGYVYVTHGLESVPDLRVDGNVGNAVSIYLEDPVLVEMGYSGIVCTRWQVYAMAIDEPDLCSAIPTSTDAINGRLNVELSGSVKTSEFSISRNRRVLSVPESIVVCRERQTARLLLSQKAKSINSVKSSSSGISCSIDMLTETSNGTALNVTINADLSKLKADSNGSLVFRDSLAFYSGANDVPEFRVPIVFWTNGVK